MLALVSQSQKSGKEGEAYHICLVLDQAQWAIVDVKANEIPPRWPPVLPRGSFSNITWELTTVDTTSISFVVNRILKVNSVYFVRRINN